MSDNDLNRARTFLEEALAMLLRTGECWPVAVRVRTPVNVLRRRPKARRGPGQRSCRKAG